MRYIKTFESFSPVNEEEENFFKKLMQGGTEIDMSSENFEKLKAKYCNVNETPLAKPFTDDKTIKATKTSLFTLGVITKSGENIIGDPSGMLVYHQLMKNFKMNEDQALTAAMGIYEWNGWTNIDKNESKFDVENKKFSVVKDKSRTSVS
jgi:hypothetical protein